MYMLKFVMLFVVAAASFGPIEWHHNLDEAKSLALKEHRHILLNFSGSDWCGPCIRLREEIFAKTAFQEMADTSLVLVNADFPRMKKNQLPESQQQLNDAMADKYNSHGKFPLTVLLTGDGRVLKTWEGFPNATPDEFAHEVQNVIDADK